MTVAEQVRNCPVCGEEFSPYRGAQTFCSNDCRMEAHRQTMPRLAGSFRRGETAAILPSETKPSRTAKMTDGEMDVELIRIRRDLDARPHIPGDRHWRLEQMATQRLNGWQVSQIARYHGVSPDVVKEILGE